MACARGTEAVKVVLIETQYVKTDSMSFKSVVQNLTGKDSCVTLIEKSRKRKRQPVATASGASGFERSGGAGGNKNISMLTEGLSFKDLDKLILEAPPMEELLWLWAE
ncbi:VQ motif-containing protein 10-like [Alnus glutinosa]|uniref:VQ motif-containing protein 10-like n=1 Tax=Alnus glutinosa TaxID=3517 RepID=UPI002D7954E2|nr:VQ motif-containing protein 10-like [Alnus glutinosa]